MNKIDQLLNIGEHVEFWKVSSGEIACSLQNCEVKDGDFLVGTFGRGKTVEEAVENYCNLIAGKRLVFHACSKNRYEVIVLQS